MTSWVSTKLRKDGLVQHIHHTEPNGPPLFLIHGFSDSSRSWKRLATDLADRYTIYAPDMYGHGESTPLVGPTTVASFVSDIFSVMDHFKIEKAAVCGHSMGGAIVGEMSRQRPDRITALILEDPAWGLDTVPVPAYIGRSEKGKEWHDWLIDLRKLSWEDALISISGDTQGWAQVDVKAYLEDRLTCDLSIFEQLDFSIRNGWREAMHSNKAPMLLVTGDAAKGGIINDDFAATIFAENGGGERLHVAAAGHGIHREQYLPFYEGVRSFLKKHLS